MGLQSKAACLGLGCLYIVALPLAVIFAFVCEWKVYGLWVGVTIGQTLEFFLYARLIIVTSWERVAMQTTERIQGELERLNPKQEDEGHEDTCINS